MSKKNGKKGGKDLKPEKKLKKHEHSPPMAEHASPGDSAADEYLERLTFLQTELVKLQRHWIENGEKILIILEGRDAAGKDGALKAITQHMSPRQTRVVALPKPDERERTEWYFQRYMPHLPAGGETVFFNRSWYNRAGVEPVMGFCKPEETALFLQLAPEVESVLVRSGIRILKFYLDLSKDEQAERLQDRRDDPLDFWKVGPIDEAAQKKWDDYSRRRNEMLLATHKETAPWIIVHSNKKKKARLAMLAYLLNACDYPKRSKDLPAPDPDILFSFEPGAITDGRIAP
jgi:polyphosphate kinase